jgi:hypothetical protein
VSTERKALERLLRGDSDRDFRFAELGTLLESLGFTCRVRGDHHIYTRPGVREILNVQPRRDGSAKPYQVRQVRLLVLAYGLGELQ